MIRLMEEDQLPPPEFEENAGGFRVTLRAGAPSIPATDAVADLEQFAHIDLNQRQGKAIEFLLIHRRITNRDYQQLCPEVHAETLRRDLADLVSQDALLKVGDKRATYYILKQSRATGKPGKQT
jgi:ATP-dependent DNA helicase RecG